MNFRAAVLAEVGQPLQTETLELRGLAETDVLVRIEATSICHTDVEVIDGHLAVPLPLVPGHEGAGTVEKVGEGVRSLKVGDSVVLSWNPHCGDCFFCNAISRSCVPSTRRGRPAPFTSTVCRAFSGPVKRCIS